MQATPHDPRPESARPQAGAQAADHLLVPCAYASAEGAAQALQTLALPHLARWLDELAPTGDVWGDADGLAPTPPHEQALAAALGLPPETPPWAAWAAGVDARPCAWFTPCHWNVGMEQVTLLAPDTLRLSEADSQALLAALSPYAAEDGIDLRFETPTRWRAEGEVFRAVRCASIDRVIGRPVDLWMPDGPQAQPLRRLQNEAQMLFYTHPVNDARSAQGLPPVNSFWIHGSGVWAPDTPTPTAPTETPARPEVVESLRLAALQGDWAAWAGAWRALDADIGQRWWPRAQRGERLRLTLCGERHARTLATPESASGWPVLHQAWRRLSGWSRSERADARLKNLLGGL